MARAALVRSGVVSQLGKSPMSSTIDTESYIRAKINKQNDVTDNVIDDEDEDKTGPDYDVITINVGGVFFQTYRKTFTSKPACRLGNRKFMSKHYNEAMSCYFFDRDPDMFKTTLNYLRTGTLHLPSYVCGPAAKKELEFWGILPNEIEQCCWINYNEWNSTQEALQRLEKDRKTNDDEADTPEDDPNASFWSKCRPKGWRILNNSNAGYFAKFLSFLSLTVVVVSIFSFLAETTQPFEYYEPSIKTATNTTSDLNTTTTNGTTSIPEPDDDNEKDNGVKVKHPVLHIIDICCVSYFIVEYVTRLIFSPNKRLFVLSLLSVIDILAILPDVIETSIYYFRPELREDVDAVSYITLLRVIRVLRIFRLVRHSAGLWILIYTMRASFSELMLLVWFMGLGILLFSSLIYYVEDRELFPSIPYGFWWALITMTTVGYGDIYPKNELGKVVGSMCAMAGVLMIGFTVPALVNNFMLYYRHIHFAMQVEKMEEEMKKMNLELELQRAADAAEHQSDDPHNDQNAPIDDDAECDEGVHWLVCTSNAIRSPSDVGVALIKPTNGRIETLEMGGKNVGMSVSVDFEPKERADSTSLSMDTAI